MIDLDQMDEQLTAALTDRPRRAPASPARTPRPAQAPRRRERPAPVPAAVGGPGTSAADLLELGLLGEADARAAAGADRRDAVTWATMRALLAGREDAVRAGVEELAGLARTREDPEALHRSWVQRFWAAFEWGSDGERHDVLDHCRERAYRFDDLPWWGNLTLLLATMGKRDEAVRAFDASGELLAGATGDRRAQDVVTNLVEAAAVLGDAGRMATVSRRLRGFEATLVVVGPGVVCKGSLERYRALSHAALGDRARAGDCFRRAESVHRGIGAAPLLARTLRQASGASVAA